MKRLRLGFTAIFLPAIGIALILLSATQLLSVNRETTEKQVSFTYLERGKGKTPVLGNEITVLYGLADHQGRLLDNVQKVRAAYILGLEEFYDVWNETILQLREGDRVLVREQVGEEESYTVLQLFKISSPMNLQPYDIPGKTRIRTASGLEYILITDGGGLKAAPGYTLTLHFTCFLEDETMLSSTYEQGMPITVTLGIDPVPPGWYEGLSLMREGDRMRLVVPAAMNHNEDGNHGGFPLNVLLVFEIDLLEVK